jgi:hypothetical protein
MPKTSGPSFVELHSDFPKLVWSAMSNLGFNQYCAVDDLVKPTPRKDRLAQLVNQSNHGLQFTASRAYVAELERVLEVTLADHSEPTAITPKEQRHAWIEITSTSLWGSTSVTLCTAGAVVSLAEFSAGTFIERSDAKKVAKQWGEALLIPVDIMYLEHVIPPHRQAG